MFDDVRPTVVYNCAAFHNVEVCEREEDRAFEVNARAVKRLAARCADARRAARPPQHQLRVRRHGRPSRTTRTTLPNPRSIYAISKLAGEHAALAYAPGALVVRTAGLYGLHGSASKGGNFVTRMIARAREQGALKVVADQRLTPTFTADLAAGDPRGGRGGRDGHRCTSPTPARPAGTGSPRRSWSWPASSVPVEAVSTVRQPGAADRPLNGVLVSPVSERAGLAPLRPWRDALSPTISSAPACCAAAA